MSDLSASQLADLVAKSKLMLGIGDDDATYHSDAFAVYHDESASATAATVQVDGTDLVLIITGGTNAGTVTTDLTAAANDTIAELVAVINALAKGWVATQLGQSAVDSALLVRTEATSAFGQDNEQTLVAENLELLEQIIQNVWAAIEKWVYRGLLTTDYTGELVDAPAGTRLLVLKNPDITAVSSLSTYYGSGLSVEYSGSDLNPRVWVTDAAVVTSSHNATTGVATVTSSTFASNVTTTAMATTINALSGWTSTVVNNQISTLLVRTGVQDAANKITLEYWDDLCGEFTIDGGAGVLEFGYQITAPNGKVRVSYTAGLATIPADIEAVILGAVKSVWDFTSKDGAVSEEKLGDYSYKLAGQGAASDLDSYDSILGKYRRYQP